MQNEWSESRLRPHRTAVSSLSLEKEPTKTNQTKSRGKGMLLGQQRKAAALRRCPFQRLSRASERPCRSQPLTERKLLQGAANGALRGKASLSGRNNPTGQLPPHVTHRICPVNMSTLPRLLRSVSKRSPQRTTAHGWGKEESVPKPAASSILNS